MFTTGPFVLFVCCQTCVGPTRYFENQWTDFGAMQTSTSGPPGKVKSHEVEVRFVSSAVASMQTLTTRPTFNDKTRLHSEGGKPSWPADQRQRRPVRCTLCWPNRPSTPARTTTSAPSNKHRQHRIHKLARTAVYIVTVLLTNWKLTVFRCWLH